MSAADVLLLVLGAIAGAIAAPLYNRGVATVANARRRRATTKRGRDDRHSLLARKLVAYYVERGRGSALYTPKMIGTGDPIAVLHDPTVKIAAAVDFQSDPLFSCDHQLTRLPFDKAVVRRYRHRGVRIFDGEFMWVKGARLDGEDLVDLRVGRVNFYSYATLLHKTQREILSRWRRPVFHDRYLQSFQSALGGGGIRPQAIGSVVALLVEAHDGTHVALARRSAQVVNGPGARTLVPVYGMECEAIAGRVSRYGLTFYNFAREFSEEFFDLEDLVHMMISRRVDPDWIFHLPPAAEVLNEAMAGRLIFRRTGACINPNDAILNFAYVAHFTDPLFLERLISQVRPNWENSASADLNIGAIEFVRLSDSKLDQLAVDQLIDPSSIFSLDLARQYVADLADKASPDSATT